MGFQNYLGVNKGRIKLRLDTSELYDYNLSNNFDDLYLDVINNDASLSSDGLIIDDNLIGHQSFLFSILLSEFDNSINDENYIYSGLTLTLNFTKFKNYLNINNVFYEDVFLNSHVYVYTGFTNEVHYFKIDDFNQEEYIDPIFNGDMDYVIGNFEKRYLECISSINDEPCCELIPKYFNKPMVFKVDSCTNLIQRRPELGWSLDFIFNRNYLDWNLGGIFYFLGVRGETDPLKLADNNLSFAFTPDRRIAWYSLRFSGVTNETVGFTGNTYVSSGTTAPICVTGNSTDFKVSIVFERYRQYDLNEIDYNGGKWDMVTGCTIENDIINVLSGETEVYTYSEELTKKWSDNKFKRLGTLKIYLNGYKIYSIENWEEIVPADRGYQPLIQSWGGGAYLFNGLFYKLCYFNIKSFRYYEKPLLATEIKQDFEYSKKYFNFEICGDNCN